MIPSSIPTSFIPHPESSNINHRGVNSTGIFSFICYATFAVVSVLAISVFLYSRFLISQESAKSSALAKATEMIDSETIKSFIRLRDRLTSGGDLLSGHPAFSGFFTSLGKIVPSTVRFSSLHLSINDDGVVHLDGLGSAENFNALAATSIAFAKDGGIKNAIFSDISVSAKDSSVSFGLSATIAPEIVTFSPKNYIVAHDISSSSVSSTTSVISGQATSTQTTP